MSQLLTTLSEVNQSLIQTIYGATEETFMTMAYMETQLLKTEYQKAPAGVDDLLGHIQITGEAGAVALTAYFTRASAEMLVGALVGAAPDQLSQQDFKDGIGELLNMVAGKVKARLSSEAEDYYKLSIPDVKMKDATGEEEWLPSLMPSFCLMEFNLGGTPFYLGVNYYPKP